MKTEEVKALMRARFSTPEWAIFFEVGDGTGAGQRRWADAVAMNMYPSRGLEVHGFEVKVSREDWLRELKNPEKSALVQQYCDRWWIVCPKALIKPGELPPTWGHYDVTPTGLRQVVAAPKLNPQDVSKSFVAALLRRSSGVSADEIEAAVLRERERVETACNERIEREVSLRTERGREAQKALVSFEKLTGLSINRWNQPEIVAQAVNLVLKLGVFRTYGLLSQLQRNARELIEECDAVLSTFKDEAGVTEGEPPQGV
ncbi:TPA: hypothetical protein ACTYAS_003707 [Enterobacter kobei]